QIVPVTRSLFLCDFHVGYQDGRVDLHGIFNVLRPAVYPHRRGRFVVYAQLTGGVGDVPFHLEVRRADGAGPGYRTPPRTLRFADRVAVQQLAVAIEGVRFVGPGLYLVELYCHGIMVCDTTLRLR
ncbi:MAG: hypothetical protein K2X82_32340, partial [Gemmataceae bacterium]|nr:hypothetical protein [Gemmataceae bacterium]